MGKVLYILRCVITLLTTTIFAVMLSLFSITTENIFLIIITISFSFVLIGTTVIDVFKKRKFSKIYSITMCISMLIVLYTMLRPLLDTLYINGLDFKEPSYILNNCLILFSENLLVYLIIFILIFIGNYINYKIEPNSK